jgi:hypothetical protein
MLDTPEDRAAWLRLAEQLADEHDERAAQLIFETATGWPVEPATICPCCAGRISRLELDDADDCGCGRRHSR